MIKECEKKFWINKIYFFWSDFMKKVYFFLDVTTLTHSRFLLKKVLLLLEQHFVSHLGLVLVDISK